MGRVYRVCFDNVLLTGAGDLLQIKGVAHKTLKIRRQWAGVPDTSPLTNQNLSFRGRVLPVTVSDGGGSSAGISKTDQGDAAASFSALGYSTSKATTNGTAVEEETVGVNVYGGYAQDFSDRAQPTIRDDASWVFELLSTPSGTVHLSGGVEVEEIG